MRSVLTVLCLLLFAAPSLAQTPTILAGTPFQVISDHADAATAATGFRCYIDNVKVGADLPLSARAGGKFTCAMPGQTGGSHTVQTSAFNAFGETKSAPLTVLAGSAPSGPTNLQIVVQVAVQQNGSVTLLASSVSRLP